MNDQLVNLSVDLRKDVVLVDAIAQVAIQTNRSIESVVRVALRNYLASRQEDQDTDI